MAQSLNCHSHLAQTPVGGHVEPHDIAATCWATVTSPLLPSLQPQQWHHYNALGHCQAAALVLSRLRESAYRDGAPALGRHRGGGGAFAGADERSEGTQPRGDDGK